jgi:hypothetical protein
MNKQKEIEYLSKVRKGKNVEDRRKETKKKDKKTEPLVKIRMKNYS